MFDLTLVAASSTGHDAIDGDGIRVEIKATYGSSGVSIRKTSDLAATSLIVLRLSRTPHTQHEVIFNGPLEIARQAADPVQSNGQARMSLVRLRALNETVAPAARVPRRNVTGRVADRTAE